MLPAALSEQLLSLIPASDRDTLSLTMLIDQEGVVTSTGPFEARIRSACRVNYQDVANLLEGGSNHSLADPAITDALFWLHTAAVRIGTQRERRGGISSTRLEGNADADDGAAVAHDLIERLMVAANEQVAAWLVTHAAPGPFRAHPAPAAGAGAEIDRFAATLGFRLGLAGPLTPHSLRAVETTLSASKDDRVDVVWELLLGHLGRAVYQGDPSAHFGLGSDNYLHFTSPLRRYADLEVHRRCKEIIHGTAPAPADAAHAALCDHLNLQTGLAARAEREVTRTTRQVDLVRSGHSSNTFDGRIIGFAKPGVRVAFADGQLSGMVRWRDFDRARYEIDEGAHSISSPGHPTFSLGEQVSVTVANIDLERGDIDLARARS
jgi:ribonuclease R